MHGLAASAAACRRQLRCVPVRERGGDVGATATAWAALANASGAENRAAAGRAWAYIAGKGGIPSIAALLNQGDASPLFVAIAGKLPPDALPATPLVLGLIHGAESFLETRFHVGIVMMGYATGILVRRLRGDWGPDGNRKDWFTRLECDHAVGLVSSMQNGEGSGWNAYAEPTASQSCDVVRRRRDARR